MARLLIQSARTWQFLHWSSHTGDVGWTPSLFEALRSGVIDDMEQAAQLLDDHVDRGTGLVIDLDGDYAS